MPDVSYFINQEIVNMLNNHKSIYRYKLMNR
jgi:hypothetical protein